MSKSTATVDADFVWVLNQVSIRLDLYADALRDSRYRFEIQKLP